MNKVAITDYKFPDLEIERSILEPLRCTVAELKKFQSRENLMALVSDADYVITQLAPIDIDVIGAMKKCKVIVRYGIGVDNVDLKAAAAKNIPVCNIPDFCIDEVADTAAAMILALTRQIAPNWDGVRRGEWKLAVPLDQMRVLRDMTVGLVAYGKIGREVALRLKPFKCKILVFDPGVDASRITRDGCIPVSFDDLIRQSDLISLHCPSTDQTRYMINAQSIGKMKKGVLLVNTSRGALVQTPDLVAALQSGRIAAAALDVTDPEPIPADHPLVKAPNVIINSHIASSSFKAVMTLRTRAANIVACAVRGEKLPNIVNGVAG
jgi:D-3-phosphoglycerate dehydrogenase / 2-oxoglutarate reductase